MLKVYETVLVPAFNKAYALTEFNYEKHLGPSEPVTVELEGRMYQTAGLVGEADRSWVMSLFHRPPVYLDGRSSLSDISFCFKRKQLIELKEVKINKTLGIT